MKHKGLQNHFEAFPCRRAGQSAAGGGGRGRGREQLLTRRLMESGSLPGQMEVSCSTVAQQMLCTHWCAREVSLSAVCGRARETSSASSSDFAAWTPSRSSQLTVYHGTTLQSITTLQRSLHGSVHPSHTLPIPATDPLPFKSPPPTLNYPSSTASLALQPSSAREGQLWS